MKHSQGHPRFKGARPQKRRFILFDGRAAGGDTSDATVLCIEDTMNAAKASARSFGEAVIFSFVEGPAPAGSKSDYLIADLRFEQAVRS